MPMRKRRFSEVSDIETDPICTMDPMFRQGRLTQLFGLAAMPLIPGFALVVYCCVLLASAINDMYLSTNVVGVLKETTFAWNLALALLEEMDAVVSLLAGNGTVILGQMMEFYSPTDVALAEATHLLAEADVDLSANLRNHRANQADLQNTSISIEVQFYSGQVSIVGDAIYRRLDEDLRVSFWPKLVSYYSLLQVLAQLGLERSLGMVSYVQGYLSAGELEMFSGSLELSGDHIITASLYSPVVHNTYDRLYTSNEYLIGWIDQARESILENGISAPNLLGSLVWHRKVTSLIKVIRNMERSLGDSAQMTLDDSMSTSARLIAYYVIVLFVIVFLITPFLSAAAYKSVLGLYHYSRTSDRKNFELKKEKRKTEVLLNEMLPRAVAYRMRKGEEIEAETYESVTIFFSDITDFTEISAQSDPIDIVLFLNEIYQVIDAHVVKYDVYKVETISASYMVASGLPSRNGTRHSIEIARFSLDLMQLTTEFVISHMPDRVLQLRVGCHTGSAVAGVVGLKMPRYCLFGDTINTASRMQSNGLPRKIHLSQSTYKHLSENGGYVMEHRGTIQVKGKGAMNTYWLTGRREKQLKTGRVNSMSVYERAVMKIGNTDEED